jgi:hypothetical protein
MATDLTTPETRKLRAEATFRVFAILTGKASGVPAVDTHLQETEKTLLALMTKYLPLSDSDVNASREKILEVARELAATKVDLVNALRTTSGILGTEMQDAQQEADQTQQVDEVSLDKVKEAEKKLKELFTELKAEFENVKELEHYVRDDESLLKQVKEDFDAVKEQARVVQTLGIQTLDTGAGEKVRQGSADALESAGRKLVATLDQTKGKVDALKILIRKERLADNNEAGHITKFDKALSELSAITADIGRLFQVEHQRHPYWEEVSGAEVDFMIKTEQDLRKLSDHMKRLVSVESRTEKALFDAEEDLRTGLENMKKVVKVKLLEKIKVLKEGGIPAGAHLPLKADILGESPLPTASDGITVTSLPKSFEALQGKVQGLRDQAAIIKEMFRLCEGLQIHFQKIEQKFVQEQAAA